MCIDIDNRVTNSIYLLIIDFSVALVFVGIWIWISGLIFHGALLSSFGVFLGSVIYYNENNENYPDFQKDILLFGLSSWLISIGIVIAVLGFLIETLGLQLAIVSIGLAIIAFGLSNIQGISNKKEIRELLKNFTDSESKNIQEILQCLKILIQKEKK